jgi:riboflavin synthase
LSILPVSAVKSNSVFTGLIEEVGQVQALESRGNSAELALTAPRIAAGVAEGDSVAVNGCCLTVSQTNDGQLRFDLLAETLKRSNLKELRPDAPVNLERALAAGAPVGGHFVQGHVDCVAKVISFKKIGEDHRLEIELPPDFARYTVPKGSIAVNGVSLTIAELSANSFTVWIIPFTKQHTNLAGLQTGQLVNLEFDTLAKYVERMLAARVPDK